VRLVVFGWGNIARGDDGLGPLLLARIVEARWPDATLIEDFQLQLEHALDLQGADLALFLDAGKDTPAPFSFTEIHAGHGTTHTSHALAPEAVLGVYEKTLGGSPPPSFLLCVRGESFELGEGLSAEGAARLEAAWAFLQRLRSTPSPESWRALATV
jgi:hydrogenase maturation protease